MADHVFTNSLCLFLGLSFDLAVDIEACMVAVEDFLDKGKADELLAMTTASKSLKTDLYTETRHFLSVCFEFLQSIII